MKARGGKKEMSPSQRLRLALMELHAAGGGVGEFEEYYRARMAGIEAAVRREAARVRQGVLDGE